LLIAVIALSAGGSASAEELWNPHLRGADEGLASGALPPQGVYFINNSYFAAWNGYDGSGKQTGVKLDAYVDAPVVLWNPGFKVRGAQYAVAIAQPFDYTSVYSGSTATLGNGHTGLYNTVIVPAILSWSLPNDLHLKTSLSTYANDPTNSPAHPYSQGGAGSGNSFWTIEPGVALSWLHSGWNVSADFKYAANLKDTSTDYQSGDEFAADYTVTKTVNKWTGGLGAYQVNQLRDDKVKGVSTPGTIRLSYGAGPIVGYDFGSVTAQITYNWNIKTENDFGGNFINVRIIAGKPAGLF
jgi:hypothetical protein